MMEHAGMYAVVRCELQGESGDAFVVGLYDLRSKKGLGTVSFPIGKPAAAPAAQEFDANRAVSRPSKAGLRSRTASIISMTSANMTCRTARCISGSAP